MKHLLFSLLLVVLAVGMVNAQMVSGISTFTVTGLATELVLTPYEDVAIIGVVANTYYNVYIVEGVSSIQPIVSGSEEAGDIGFDLACDPYADVAFQFILPTKLLGATTVMPINFTGVVRTGELPVLYNPNVPLVINGGLEGAAQLLFTYNFTVPKVIELEGWAGSIVAIASYQ